MTDDRPDETRMDDALTDPAFDALFTALREAGRRPPPPVGPALAELLATGATSRRRRGVRGATVGLAVAGVLAGGVGAAAATGHLQAPPPVVARVVDRPTEVIGDPLEHPAREGVLPGTVTVRKARAEDDPQDVDPRPDADPAPQPAPPREGESSPSHDRSTDDDDDGDVDDEATGPASQVPGDDDSDDDGGEHSGRGGGDGDRSDEPDGGASRDGADGAG